MFFFPLKPQFGWGVAIATLPRLPGNRFGFTTWTTKSPGLHPEFLADLVLNFLIAGRDTTAQALSWCLFQVMQHPEVEERILEDRSQCLGLSYHGLRTSSGWITQEFTTPKRAGTWWKYVQWYDKSGWYPNFESTGPYRKIIPWIGGG